jgi:hypothetical protein
METSLGQPEKMKARQKTNIIISTFFFIFNQLKKKPLPN